MSEFTQLLQQIDRGDAHAAEKLLPLVYDELRELAASKMARECSGQKHDATSLVHEAYARLAGGASHSWDNRAHFFAAAAEAMRRILIDDARRRRRQRHGGDVTRVDLDADCIALPAESDDLLALDEALSRFAIHEPAKAQLVKMKYFGGMSIEESAAALSISSATAKRYWAFARAWLHTELSDEAER